MKGRVMTANRPRVIETSEDLRHYYRSMSESLKSYYEIDLLRSDNGVVECEDALFIGDDRLFIVAVDDGRFWLSTGKINPNDADEDILERGRQTLEDLKAGISKEILLINEIGRYGEYFNTCKEAIDTAISWIDVETLELKVDMIPRYQIPPIQKTR